MYYITNCISKMPSAKDRPSEKYIEFDLKILCNQSCYKNPLLLNKIILQQWFLISTGQYQGQDA